MATPIDREGQFKGLIVEYGLTEAESGALGVNIRVSLTHMWKQGDDFWEPWEQYLMEAEGTIWLVKKDNKGPNAPGIESLVKWAGWDGDLASIQNNTWQPTPCQVAIKRDEYKGNVRFKIAFVNDHDRTPGAMSNVAPDRIGQLATQYGGQFRAIAANVKRNNATTMPGQSAEPPRPPAPPAAPLTPADHRGQSSDGIPF